MDLLTVLKDFGFPIFCVLACGIFIFKLVNRHDDEAIKREEKYQEMLVNNTKELSKISDTISSNQAVTREILDTNKMLVDKCEIKLETIDGNVEKILEKLN